MAHTELVTWQRRVFAATWFSYFAYYFGRKPFSIAKSTLQKTYGWEPSDLGDLGAIYLLAYTAGQFMAGFAGNRLGPRRVLLTGMTATLITSVLFGFTSSFAVFALLMGFNGFAQATGWSANVGTMGAWFPRAIRGRVLGVWTTNFQVGALASAWLAAACIPFGLLPTFLSGAAIVGLGIALVAWGQRNRPEDVGLHVPDVPEVPADDSAPPHEDGGWTRDVVTDIGLIAAFYFCAKFIRYAIWSWAPYLLETQLGLKADEAGYVSTIFDLSGIAGVVTLGWVSDRFFAGRRVLPCLLSVVALAISTGLLYTVGTTDVRLFALFMGMIGFTLYGPDAMLTSTGAIDVGPRKNAALAAGVISGFGSMGPVVQEVLLGRQLNDGDVGAVARMLLFSAVGALAALSVLLVRTRRGHSRL